MSEEFFIKIIQDGITKAQTEAKKADDMRAKALKDAEAQEREFVKRSIALDKMRLQSMSKNDKEYYSLKENIRQRELASVKNLSDQQRSILQAGLRNQIADEKAKYSESISLANQLQNTLNSVFQRAVFYTAIYKGISAITGGIQSWVDSNIELDYALGKVNTISEVTVGQMSKILDISKLTGRSAVDLTNALYEINSANIKGADAMRVMEVSTRAAVGGFTSAEDAADTLTDVLNAYKLSASQTEMVSDKLLKAVEIGKVKWEEYHGVLGRILPSAYNLGVSLDELLGSLSTLTLSGLKFNEATVGMRNLFMKMLKPTRDMDMALANLNNNLGTSYTSIKDVLKVKGVIGTLQLLGDAMKGADLEASDLFNNVRGLTAQLSLMSDAGAKANEVTEQIANSTGFTNRQMGIMGETIVETKNRMVAAWQALGVEVFGFGDIMKGLYRILTGTANALSFISPLIVGLIASVSTLAVIMAAWGAKLLFVTYALPALKIGIVGLTGILGLNAKVSAATALNMELLNMGFLKARISAIAAALGVSTFTAAMAAATLGLTLVIGALAAWFSYTGKVATSEQMVVDRTNDMAEAFQKAKIAADLMGRTRPFEGWEKEDLSKQIEQNNKQLERRAELLKWIEIVEKNLQYLRSEGYSEESIEILNRRRLLKDAKSELREIEGSNGENLIMFEQMSKELTNVEKKVSNIGVFMNEIGAGTEYTKEQLLEFDIPNLNSMQKKASEFIDKLNEEMAINPEFKLNDFQRNIYNFYHNVTDAIVEQEADMQKKRDLEALAAEKSELDRFDKYYRALNQLTFEGRMRQLKIDEEFDLKKATLEGATNKDLLTIKQYYNNLRFEETKKNNEKLNKEAEEFNKKQIALAEKRAKAEQQINEWRKKSNQEVLDQFDKIEKERQDLIDTYLKSEITKIEEKYQKEMDLATRAAKSGEERQKLYNAIEIQRDKELTEAKIAEWQKQNEFYARGIDAITSIAQSSIQTILDTETTGSEKIRAIWETTKNFMITSFAEIIAGWIKSQLLKLAIDKTMATATITTNALMTKSYLSLAAAMSLASWGASATAGSTAYIASLTAVTGANLTASVSDAIIQDGRITPFRKDDVVAIGTNLYGTRSGYGAGGVESKLDKLINLSTVGNVQRAKQKWNPNINFNLDDSSINNANRRGERKNRIIE